jgi:peptidoglycan hydrolase CwlO-like protein
MELAELDVQYNALNNEVVEVKDENDDLKEENQELKRQMEVLEQAVKDGVKRHDDYEKRVRALSNEI